MAQVSAWKPPVLFCFRLKFSAGLMRLRVSQPLIREQVAYLEPPDSRCVLLSRGTSNRLLKAALALMLY